MKHVVGIDEVGRGPLAGPVAVGVVLVLRDFDWDLIPGVTDSKKLSEGKREEIFCSARRLKGAGLLDYAVSMVSAPVIDRISIVPAIDLAMRRALKRITTNPPLDWSSSTTHVLLDGGLTAPSHFQQQETIIKGDAKEPAIGLASIMAKVTRDRYMVRAAARPGLTPYDFAKHKGYGTEAHRHAIKSYGFSSIHRTTFCKNINIRI